VLRLSAIPHTQPPDTRTPLTRQMRRLYKELSSREIHIQRLEARLRLMADQIESLVKLEHQQADAEAALAADGDALAATASVAGGIGGAGAGLLRPRSPQGAVSLAGARRVSSLTPPPGAAATAHHHPPVSAAAMHSFRSSSPAVGKAVRLSMPALPPLNTSVASGGPVAAHQSLSVGFTLGGSPLQQRLNTIPMQHQHMPPSQQSPHQHL